MMKFHKPANDGFQIAAVYEASRGHSSLLQAGIAAADIARRFGIAPADVPTVGAWYRYAANSAWPDWRRLDAKIAADLDAAATREEIRAGASLEQIAARLGFG